MADRLRRRGPDGEGAWSCGWAALGHRRLKVIDLSDAAAQPMEDPDSGATLVFNGCIYNYKALRQELGGPFLTTSDTEAVLAAYARWGERFVDHLIGIFAIVIVDARRRRVVMARDGLGVKPLYLSEKAGRLRFASSLPALLTAGDIDTEVDPVGLHHFLSWHSIVPGTTTLLRGVTKLPPATVRVIDADGTHHDRVFWRPDYRRDPDRSAQSADDWTEALHDSLLTAVRRQLVADVPVGVLLSGGLDSSLLVALIMETGLADVRTFSIGFEDAGDEAGNEFRWSDAVAARFGSDHERIDVASEDFAAAVPSAIAAMAEPMATQDATAFWLLGQEVSRHLRVVQSGQGADEVFAGYGYHAPATTSPRNRALDAFTGAFLDRSAEKTTSMLHPDVAPPGDPSMQLLHRAFDEPGAETALDAVLRTDTHLLMPDDPVKRVDSMTASWGLEARVPFLDQDLVELAAACPPELKAADGGKGILKRLGRSLLPADVVDRPKGYFPVPAVTALQEPFRSLAIDALTPKTARVRQLLRPDVYRELLNSPDSQRTRVGGNVIWQLGILEAWLQENHAG